MLQKPTKKPEQKKKKLWKSKEIRKKGMALAMLFFERQLGKL